MEYTNRHSQTTLEHPFLELPEEVRHKIAAKQIHLRISFRKHGGF